MKKEKVTTNKVTSKLEKVLWAVLILMFIVSLIGMFLGQYMDGNVFYKNVCDHDSISCRHFYQQTFLFWKKKWEEICQKHLRSVTG